MVDSMRLKILFSCLVLSLMAVPVEAISKTQENAIKDHCAAMQESLRSVQKSDARTRVYLGSRYETILNQFVTPLNMRLVENNMSTVELIESQNNLANTRTKFTNDYIEYQQKLEELVAVDCKKAPGEFYDKLAEVRKGRKKVEQDTQKMRKLIDEYKQLVVKLKGGLK